MWEQPECGRQTAVASVVASASGSPSVSGFCNLPKPSNGLQSLLRVCLETGRIVALLAVRDMLAAGTGLLQGTQAEPLDVAFTWQ